jgi:hypothetical protein
VYGMHEPMNGVPQPFFLPSSALLSEGTGTNEWFAGRGKNANIERRLVVFAGGVGLQCIWGQMD